MLSARVIPCLDVDNGRVVKGVKFKELRDAGDPVLVAQAYEEQGADELVFLDITASSDNRNTMKEVVEKTAEYDNQIYVLLSIDRASLRSRYNSKINKAQDEIAIILNSLNKKSVIQKL